MAGAVEVHQFLAPYHSHCHLVARSRLVGGHNVVEAIASVTAVNFIASRRDNGVAIDREMVRALAPIAIYGIGAGWRRKKAENDQDHGRCQSYHNWPLAHDVLTSSMARAIRINLLGKS